AALQCSGALAAHLFSSLLPPRPQRVAPARLQAGRWKGAAETLAASHSERHNDSAPVEATSQHVCHYLPSVRRALGLAVVILLTPVVRREGAGAARRRPRRVCRRPDEGERPEARAARGRLVAG